MNSTTLQRPATRNKNKTLAAWLALVGGGFGWHRLYLYGWSDMWAWAHAIPTALGLWGVDRVLTYGQDDKLSWLLLPLLGFSLAAACLTGILYALQSPSQWNATHNPAQDADAPAGRTNWLTIGALVFALMFGTIGLMSSLAFGFQRYFEYQIEEGLKISQ
jgi:hypothetical protein